MKPLTKHVTVTCETYTILLYAHKEANSRLTGSLRARQDSETRLTSGTYGAKFGIIRNPVLQVPAPCDCLIAMILPSAWPRQGWCLFVAARPVPILSPIKLAIR